MEYKIGAKVKGTGWFCVEISTTEEMTKEKAEHIIITELKKESNHEFFVEEIKYKKLSE
jgi:hypothetical protein